MSAPNNVLELAAPLADTVDEAEINRCLESAACLVQGFAERGAASALDALLAAADDAPADPKRIRQVAASVLQQTATLHEEVGRFLAMTGTNPLSVPNCRAKPD